MIVDLSTTLLTECVFGMTEEQLRVVLLDLFMAGSDTTSNTLAFTVLYMLHYPRVQDRLAEEIDVVAGCGRAPTLQHRAR